MEIFFDVGYIKNENFSVIVNFVLEWSVFYVLGL